MDTNEVMSNEEVIEAAVEAVEETAVVKSGKGFKVTVGIGVATFAGVLVYKYVAKPMIARYRAKKEQRGVVDVEIVDGTCQGYNAEDSEETEG